MDKPKAVWMPTCCERKPGPQRNHKIIEGKVYIPVLDIRPELKDAPTMRSYFTHVLSGDLSCSKTNPPPGVSPEVLNLYHALLKVQADIDQTNENIEESKDIMKEQEMLKHDTLRQAESLRREFTLRQQVKDPKCGVTDELMSKLMDKVKMIENTGNEILKIERKSAIYGSEDRQKEELEELIATLEFYQQETSACRLLTQNLYDASTNIIKGWREAPLVEHMMKKLGHHIKSCKECPCPLCDCIEPQIRRIGQTDKKSFGKKILSLIHETCEKIGLLESQIPAIFEEGVSVNIN